MRYSIILPCLFFITLLSCNKTDKEKTDNQPGRITDEPCSINSQPDKILVDLRIYGTATPRSQVQGQAIISQVKCSGPDLCYRFCHFEITEAGTRRFEIRAKATFPKGNNYVCLQAFYVKDTTAKINTPTKGQYLLQFYNKNILFKTDTVQVN